MAGKKITHTEDWWATAPPHIVRCSARYKSGDACRREASSGANVCGQHGALAPAVQARAAVRLQMSADDAAKWLVERLGDDNVDMRERVKIAHDVLDRSGLATVNKVLVGVGELDAVESLFRNILSDPEALLEPAPPELLPVESAEATGPPVDLSDVVDAELVEDSDQPEPAPEPAQPGAPRHIREAIAKLI